MQLQAKFLPKIRAKQEIKGASAKRRKATLIPCMSVRPHETTHLPLEGVPRNLMFENFSKIF